MLGHEEGAVAGERVPVVDFGIAKATTDGAAATTAPNGGLFTALYASPEQCGASTRSASMNSAWNSTDLILANWDG